MAARHMTLSYEMEAKLGATRTETEKMMMTMTALRRTAQMTGAM